MVVNHVQQDHQAPFMSSLYQGLQVFGPAIGRVRRKWQYAVVAPVAATWEIRHGHQLDGCDAKRDQMLEPADGGAKSAFRREGADVQLINDGLGPRPAGPSSVAPAIGNRVNHLAGPMNVFRLKARSGIWHFAAISQQKTVSRAWVRQRARKLVRCRRRSSGVAADGSIFDVSALPGSAVVSGSICSSNSTTERAATAYGSPKR